ncbi:hypothetical protein CEXT_562031 [Caerostris extrusa]|uniref:Uncharacterized protein n=1 Tax=Caerostris extrusa TaxID=172846 RepID=A0AAV4PSR1_CAEEX|nr:hypothetical protein CEXT_562031 [Caerostris extrusa]
MSCGPSIPRQPDPFPQYGDEFLPNNAVDDIHEGKLPQCPNPHRNNKDEGSFRSRREIQKSLDSFGTRIQRSIKQFSIRLPEFWIILLDQIARILNHILPEFWVRLSSGSDNQKSGSNCQNSGSYYRNSGSVARGLDQIARRLDQIARSIHSVRRQQSLMRDSLLCYVTQRNNDSTTIFTHRLVTLHGRWMGSCTLRKCSLFWKTSTQTRQLPEKHPGILLKWPKYSKQNHIYMNIDVNSSIIETKLGTGPHLENCNVLRSHYGF